MGRHRQHEAFEPAPTHANSERGKRVHKGVHLRFATWLEYHAEHPGGSTEIAQPVRVSRAVGEARMHNLADLRLLRQPSRHCQTRGLRVIHPHLKGSQAAECQKDILRSRLLSKGQAHPSHRSEGGLVTNDEADHGVGVAADKLRARVNNNIDPQAQRLTEDRRGPGAVEDRYRAALARDAGDRGNVRNLERAGTWRLEHHRRRIGAHEVGQSLTDHRIKVRDLDPVARQNGIAEPPRGPVNRVRNKHMIADLRSAGQRQRNRRQARRNGDTAVSVLKRRHHPLELEAGGIAVAVVIQRPVVVPGIARGLELAPRVEQHGRALIDRQIDRPAANGRAAPQMSQSVG